MKWSPIIIIRATPEEENVVPGLEIARRIELGEQRSRVGPPEGGEGPERAGKPGIENVFVLTEDERPAGAGRRRAARDVM